MGDLYDTISPRKRAGIGKQFLADIETETTDVDILIDEYCKVYNNLDQKILRNYLSNLADLVTDPN